MVKFIAYSFVIGTGLLSAFAGQNTHANKVASV
jgi:hypothetical protein